VSTHIGARPGEIAPTVLMPGDPLRAKWIAETFLDDAKCYNEVRGMYGYTGTYRGERVSVQGSGMGLPSLSIYVNELFREYDVRTIVRVGSCGALTEDLRLRDQSFALAAREDGELRAGGERYAPYLDQHTGRPGTGVLATVAIGQLALDAQGLAATLFVTGARRGGMLLGQLKPAPAALWVLGEAGGEPLVSDYRWGGRQRRGGG